MTEPRAYRVRVESPDRMKCHEILIPEEQVEFFIAGEKSKPFSTAAWLAYCDLWVNEP